MCVSIALCDCVIVYVKVYVMGQGTDCTWGKLSLAVLGVLWGAGIGTRASHMLGVSFPAEQSPSPLLPVWGSLYSVLGSLGLAPCASWMFTLLGPLALTLNIYFRGGTHASALFLVSAGTPSPHLHTRCSPLSLRTLGWQREFSSPGSQTPPSGTFSQPPAHTQCIE